MWRVRAARRMRAVMVRVVAARTKTMRTMMTTMKMTTMTRRKRCVLIPRMMCRLRFADSYGGAKDGRRKAHV